MKHRNLASFLAVSFMTMFAVSAVFAQATAPTTATVEPEKTEAPASASISPIFEIIDGTSQVAGPPGSTSEEARAKFSKACDEWKKETKDLNKKNEVLAISCGSADCAYQQNGSYICSATATYKLKVAGRLAPPPAPAPTPQTELAVQPSPPPLIYEVTPVAQPGFVWIPGYWGWQGHRHTWYPGHWVSDRPGYHWTQPRWVRRGLHWHFESGRWDR